MLYIDRLNILYSEAEEKIFDLISKYGQESEYSTMLCLQIEDDKLKFNLDGGRFLSEVSNETLVDNHGYTYNYSTLEYEQFFCIVDYLIKTYESASKK